MIRGLAVSPGIAQGTAYVLPRQAERAVPRRAVPAEKLEAELDRLDAALAKAGAQLADLQKAVLDTLGERQAEIFNAQVLLLKDPGFLLEIESTIRRDSVNIEAALSDVVDKFSRSLSQIQDPYLRERAADIRDVGRRLLETLLQSQASSEPLFPPGTVVVAEELFPSTTADLELKDIRAFVTEKGGRTSHAAILARSASTPAVSGVKNACGQIKTGDHLIVDGLAGTVYVNPDGVIRGEYEKLEADFQAYRRSLASVLDLPCATADGTAITLCANVGKLADVEAAFLFKADGVGLYRTEFAYSVAESFPTEDTQYAFALKAAERLHPRKVVFRLLDIGGDKNLPYLPLPLSRNPALALRGLRLLFERPEILKPQLRAFLRAGAEHPVHLLLPVVGGVEDVVRLKGVLAEAQEELTREGKPFGRDIPLGAMIELPAAALVADLLARELDFLSLGTNDLVQYTLAADREDQDMAPYYDPLHPAVLRMLRSVVDAARTRGKGLSICGEMAGDPFYVELLLGLGLRELSVAPGELLAVKNAVRAVRLEEAEKLAHLALAADRTSDVAALLEQRRKARGSGLG